MANGKSVSLQKVLKKLENIDSRLKRLEKKQSIPEVKLSPKELAGIEKAKKEIRSGSYLGEKELFAILSE
ncbi:MAG TPA: hypothetical protein VFF09_02410 [archaeon]|nr:hypothetical protein [archaeon]